MTNELHAVLYIGMTNDLSRRVNEHRSGEIPGFTADYRCHKLVYWEHYSELIRDGLICSTRFPEISRDVSTSLDMTKQEPIVALVDKNGTNAVNDLLATYGETGGINYLAAAATLPSRETIEESCADLMSLMFPGFRGEALVDSEDLPDITKSRIRNLRMRLKPEICKSLGDYPASEETKKKAEEILDFFISQLPEVRKILWTDIDASYEGDPAAKSYEEIILAYPSLEAIAIYRMAHLLYNKVPLIPRIMTEWAHSRTGIDIHPGAEIGSHFFIDHGTGVVVGETTKIGSHVKLYQGVSFIARSLAAGQALRGKKRHPTIEEGVCIYAGTTIMGGDTVIGANSTIGANVFLTKSVPPNSLVYYEEKEVAIVQKRARKVAPETDGFSE
jgi:serine O-acetyltransferase